MMLTELGLWIVVALIGLAVGSFANVCIHRIPRGKSVVMPPSHCPACGTHIRWFDNIPVLSYVLLRGRCRDCRVTISPRYLLVEVFTALIWCLAWWQAGSIWQFVDWALLFTILIIVSLIDRDHGIIPNPLSLGGMVLGVLLAIVSPERGVFAAVTGLLVPALVLAGIRWFGGRVLHRESMGVGDVKLAAMIGAFLGWQLALMALYAGFCFAAIWVLPVLLVKGRHELGAVRMGPFFAAGTLASAWYGMEIWLWILG
jgi:leader peptidase (prepilin peptidase) / N-methyltransferase